MADRAGQHAGALIDADAAPLSAAEFAERVLSWYHVNGRHDLPWQRQPTAYRVWVSEIMLQQTQVATVVPYFERFVERFPDVASLAAADLDAVLYLWSGLGYYARARHLHAAAQIVCRDHAGELPHDFPALLALPGIGRSTAGAILALARGERHAILDGNVKRVLARYFAIDGWPGRSAVARALWEHAERLTPAREVAAYTQAMMDLGATVCTRSQPRCGDCPLREGCAGFARGEPTRHPGRRPRAAQRRVRRTTMIIVRCDGGVLLLRRPAAGIWGGLWSLPEIDDGVSARGWCRRELGVSPVAVTRGPELSHSFTHFDLVISPVYADIPTEPSRVFDGEDCLWYNGASPAAVGLPAPVVALLARSAPG